MDSIKAWVVDTWGPSALRGGVLGICGMLIAHTTLLSKFGIVTDAVTNTTTIHWTKLSDAAVPIIVAVIAGFIYLAKDKIVNSLHNFFSGGIL